MYKIKIFDLLQFNRTDNSKINTWLSNNKNIQILQTNTVTNSSGGAYIILYIEKDVSNELA